MISLSNLKTTNFLAWLGRRRERKILEMAEKHMEKVVVTVKALKKTVYAFCESNVGEVKKSFDEIFKAEKEADDLKRNIIKELSVGVFHPIDRDEITRLLLTMDDIASNAKGAGARITFMCLKIKDEEILRRLKDIADRLTEIVDETSQAVKELVDNPKKALEKADRVEELEENIDDVRRELLHRILLIGDELGPSRLVCLKDVVDSMENVADRCEDTADLIRSLAILTT